MMNRHRFWIGGLTTLIAVGVAAVIWIPGLVKQWDEPVSIDVDKSPFANGEETSRLLRTTVTNNSGATLTEAELRFTFSDAAEDAMVWTR